MFLFKKVLFGCAGLAARERRKKGERRSFSPLLPTANTKPNGRAALSAHPFWPGCAFFGPRLSSDSCLKKRERSQKKKRNISPFLFLFFSFFLFCSTLSMACTGMAHEGLLPCAICVQRFGNKMILQLIPLIARCCVLQRNRKPSHPSRHVVGAVLN